MRRCKPQPYPPACTADQGHIDSPLHGGLSGHRAVDQRRQRTNEVHRGQDGERGRERRQRHAELVSAEVHRPRRQAAHRRQPAGRQRGARPCRRAQPERQADACMQVTSRLPDRHMPWCMPAWHSPKGHARQAAHTAGCAASVVRYGRLQGGGARSDPRSINMTVGQASAPPDSATVTNPRRAATLSPAAESRCATRTERQRNERGEVRGQAPRGRGRRRPAAPPQHARRHAQEHEQRTNRHHGRQRLQVGDQRERACAGAATLPQP